VRDWPFDFTGTDIWSDERIIERRMAAVLCRCFMPGKGSKALGVELFDLAW
jgi:hypothetical protein